MVLPEIDPIDSTQFSIGDHVWIIYGRSYRECIVQSIIFEMVCNDEKNILICTGYKLNAYNSNTRNSIFCPIDIYKTVAEVKRLVVWHHVFGISSHEWTDAIGSRYSTRQLNDCELPICCANISRVRDLLFKCRDENGLIQRDVQIIEELLKDHNLQMITENAPILRKILSQLGIIK